MADGSLMTIVENKMTYRDALKGIRTSTDDGVTWSEIRPVYTGPGPGIPSAGVLLRTRRKVIVLAYVDHSTFKWGWDDGRVETQDGVRADIWSVRSLDDGETWVNRHRIMKGYCGALINMIETQRGPIVAPVQMLLHDPGRHGQATFASRDQGKTWERSNIIDLGGRGHHGGADEGTVVELGDGRLLMLLRTNWDRFWEAFSMDEGLSWRVQPQRDRRQQLSGLSAASGQWPVVARVEPPLPRGPGERSEAQRATVGVGSKLAAGGALPRAVGRQRQVVDHYSRNSPWRAPGVPICVRAAYGRDLGICRRPSRHPP